MSSAQKEACALGPQQKEGRLFSCPAIARPMRDGHSSAREKPLRLELPVYSTGFLFSTAPSKFALLSVKEPFSSWFSSLAQGFAVACVSQIAILCYSQINHFAGKATNSLIFKVNMPQPRCPSSCSPQDICCAPTSLPLLPRLGVGVAAACGGGKGSPAGYVGMVGESAVPGLWFGA